MNKRNGWILEQNISYWGVMKASSGHKNMHSTQLSLVWRGLSTQIAAKERKTLIVSLKAGRWFNCKQSPVHSTALSSRGSPEGAHMPGCTGLGARGTRVRWQRPGQLWWRQTELEMLPWLWCTRVAWLLLEQWGHLRCEPGLWLG